MARPNKYNWEAIQEAFEHGFDRDEICKKHRITNKQLSNKIRQHIDDIVITESFELDDADIAIIAYGSIYRAGKAAAVMARENGLKVGLWRPVTIWPFPESQIAMLSQRVKAILVLENNLGQLVHYVKAAANGHADVRFVPPDVLGKFHHPKQILKEINDVFQ